MTQGLGFCEFCGASRIMVAQAHCVACGREISQPPELAGDRAQAGAAAPTLQAADVPAPPTAGVPDAPSPGVQPPPEPPPWAQVPLGAAPGPAARGSRSRGPIVIGIGLVAVAALAVGVYVVASSGTAPHPSPSAPAMAAGSSAAPSETSSTTSASPTSAATSASTSTPTPTPTPTQAPDVTPEVTTGSLAGTLRSVDDDAPVAGAGVILCLKSASTCTTDASLVATSDSSGAFQIDAIPAGTYVVFYNPDGAPGSAALGLTIDVPDESASCLGQGFTGSMPATCSGSVPFGDDTELTMGKSSQIGVSASGITLTSGTVRSPKYGLSLNYEAGQPLSVTVSPGTPSAVEVTVR